MQGLWWDWKMSDLQRDLNGYGRHRSVGAAAASWTRCQPAVSMSGFASSAVMRKQPCASGT